MIAGKLSNGFEFSIEEEIVLSVEFRDMMADAVSTDPNKKDRRLSANAGILPFLIGEEQKNNLYSFMREKSGKRFIPASEVDALTMEIIKIASEKNEEIKNS